MLWSRGNAALRPRGRVSQGRLNDKTGDCGTYGEPSPWQGTMVAGEQAISRLSGS